MITMPGGTDAGASASRSQRAYDYVRSRILSGEFATGVAISDVELAATLGMSKTPIRQALRLLEQEGLLERGPRRQLVVRGFSPEYRQEVLDVREALERIAIRGACRVMPIDEIDLLRVGLLRQRRAAEAGDEAAFIELDEEFHLMIARGAGLQLVYKLLSQLRGLRPDHATRHRARPWPPAARARGARGDRRGTRAAGRRGGARGTVPPLARG
jgi:DNA-binding GntR family transcriptional regulator